MHVISVVMTGVIPGQVMNKVLQHLRNNDENPGDISARTDTSDRAVPRAAHTDKKSLNQYF